MIDRYIIKFNIRLLFTYFTKVWKAPSINKNLINIEKVAVIYSIPKSSPRFNTWNDGFVDAINQLKFNITWINIETHELSEKYLNSFDFLLVKSNWNWGPDKLLREKFRNLKVQKGLAIAGVSIPPKLSEMIYYDVLWYETEWYKKIISNHPVTIHGFGINKNSLKPIKPNIKYDFISIGAFLPHKRMEKILRLKGKVLVIGESYDTDYSLKIYNQLNERDNIDILPFVKYENMSDFFKLAKTLYIPASINGGGERAILEAKHCGLEILIEKDNPKLLEILKSPIWDSKYYSNQITKGIKFNESIKKNN